MSGLVCPKCGASYRAGFTHCHSCRVDLVDPAVGRAAAAAATDPRAALAGRETTAIVHAGLAACREIERALLEAGVPCVLDATADTAALGKTAGKDARAGKATYVSLHGVAAAAHMAADETARARSALAALPGDPAFLLGLADLMLARRS